MLVRKTCKDLFNGSEHKLVFKQDEICPICHAHIVAKDLNAVSYPHKNDTYATVLNFCSGCQSCFITTYEVCFNTSGYENILQPTKLISSEPLRFVAEKFSEILAKLSPNFVEIYNQAKQAETLSLNHIAGMGYRKSLEFLIKDYAIHFHPDKEDEIKAMFLSACINAYIDSPKIKALAERSVWLGNDETHYVRKHPDLNVDDMKRFIKACYNYIESELTLEEVESIDKA